MRIRKYFYEVPVKISVENSPINNLVIKIKTAALNKRQAIAIAKTEAEKYFRSRFPTYSYSLENVNFKVVIDKIEIKGSKEINNNPKKRHKKEPLLPFDKDRIRYLPDELYKLGDQIVLHKLIIFDDWLKMKLLKEERPLVKENTLVIEGPDYVKVLTQNEENMPIFLRFELNKEKKIESMVEFIFGFDNYNSLVPKKLYRAARDIAFRILKFRNNLVKEVKNEKGF